MRLTFSVMGMWSMITVGCMGLTPSSGTSDAVAWQCSLTARGLNLGRQGERYGDLNTGKGYVTQRSHETLLSTDKDDGSMTATPRIRDA